MESDSIFGENTQSKISAVEDAFPSEIAITQASDTASTTSKHCGRYRETIDAALTIQGFVSQTPAARSVQNH